jgi:hypothetical protein
MKYVVHTITVLIYALAGAAIAFGLTLFGRAAVHLALYEPAIADPVYLPGDSYGFSYDGMCWDRYEYRVGGKPYRGPGGCAASADYRIHVLYRRSQPAESILDDISKLIAEGLLWLAFGAALGWWAYQWRSTSVAIHGRRMPGAALGSGAWGLFALLGVSAVMARDIADTREGFCDGRRAMLSSSMARFLGDHARRVPSDWLESFHANVGPDGVLSGSPACLAATQFRELPKLCPDGFHITAEADIGSAVCELIGNHRYKVDFEFQTDWQYQTVKVRFFDAP